MARRASQTVVGERGRVVLPADVCSALDLRPGTRLLLDVEPDGSLRLRPLRAVAEQGRGLLADLAPADVTAVDELIAERRREAAKEEPPSA